MYFLGFSSPGLLGAFRARGSETCRPCQAGGGGPVGRARGQLQPRQGLGQPSRGVAYHGRRAEGRLAVHSHRTAGPGIGVSTGAAGRSRWFLITPHRRGRPAAAAATAHRLLITPHGWGRPAAAARFATRRLAVCPHWRWWAASGWLCARFATRRFAVCPHWRWWAASGWLCARVVPHG